MIFYDNISARKYGELKNQLQRVFGTSMDDAGIDSLILRYPETDEALSQMYRMQYDAMKPYYKAVISIMRDFREKNFPDGLPPYDPLTLQDIEDIKLILSSIRKTDIGPEHRLYGILKERTGLLPFMDDMYLKAFYYREGLIKPGFPGTDGWNPLYLTAGEAYPLTDAGVAVLRERLFRFYSEMYSSSPFARTICLRPNMVTILFDAHIRRVSHISEEDGYCILAMDGFMNGNRYSFSLKGKIPQALITTGANFEVVGSPFRRDDYGQYIMAERLRRSEPDTKEMLAQLLRDGQFCSGLPQKTAEAIVEKLGKDALSKIREKPDCLDGIPGVGPGRKSSLQKASVRFRNVNEIVETLYSFGLRAEGICRLFRREGLASLDNFKYDPYSISRELSGVCSYEVADCCYWNNWINQDFRPDSPCRVKGAMFEVLKRNSEQGHTCMDEDDLVEKTVRLLMLKPDLSIADRVVLEEDVMRKAARELLDENDWDVIRRTLDGVTMYSIREHAVAEAAIADRVAELVSADPLSHIPEIAPEINGVRYSDEQLNAIWGCLCSRFSIITGGPGTGKTTVLAGLVNAFTLSGHSVSLAAPTAKAADRMRRVTKLQSATIHRLLWFDPEGFPQHTSSDPIRSDVVIIDESSMIDTKLMQQLLDAIGPNTAVILIGDADQLPSVGPGNVFGDLISSEICPVFRLTQIFRQENGSGIPYLASEIRQGRMPADNIPGVVQDWCGEQDIIPHLLGLLQPGGYAEVAFGLSAKDIRVITPLREGMHGSKEYASRIRDFYNPLYKPATRKKPQEPKPFVEYGPQAKFVVGDSVMQNNNNYITGIMNGDEGTVLKADMKNQTVSINFPDPTLPTDDEPAPVTFTARSAREDRLELSYAITVHKSQGSEFEGVLLILPPGSSSISTRRLLYTAVTRAKRAVFLLGCRDVMEKALGNDKDDRRNTGLYSLLREKITGGAVQAREIGPVMIYEPQPPVQAPSQSSYLGTPYPPETWL